MATKKRNRAMAKSAMLITAAMAVPSAFATEPTSVNPVIISLSGSTAMRNFTTSAGFSYLTPGTSITLNTGVSGAPQTYSAPDAPDTVYQLAAPDFTKTEDTTAGGSTNHHALQLQWHEQGSLEGISEMVNDQIGTYPGLTDASRTPNSSNPTWINQQKFLTPGSANGFTIGNFGAANSQSKVQMAISDVNAHQGFAQPGVGSWSAAPGTVGFGQGNPVLPTGSSVLAVGQAGVRHYYQPATVLNMPQGASDPAGGTYQQGPWNTAGIDNLQNTSVANTATLFVANPGTGLEHLNRTDAQFLQAQGRLANGADFNMTTRDVNSGTLNVSSANIGLDPTFAYGENDGGTGSSAEQNIGTIKFSNKSSGGTLRTTVQNSRMAVGHLVMGDAIGSTKQSTSTPLRALAYRDDANDINDNSNGASWNNYTDSAGVLVVTHGDLPSGTFVQPSITSITDGAYPIYQTENYVTVKAPSAALAGLSASAWAATTDLQTGIKGDNSGNDVADVRANILSSVKNYPQSSSIATPGDQLIATSFILPQMMLVQKSTDGLNQSQPNTSVNLALHADIVSDPSSPARFNPDPASSVTFGNGSSTYGTVTGGQGAVLINNNNYLFGNFNQISGHKGFRDFSDLIVAQQAQAALENSGLGISIFAGGANSNNTTVPNAPAAMGFAASKGDMVVLGDFNSDGVFDGQDLYLFARGAALADNTSTTTLTGNFADAVRNGVLRKNAALDFLSTAATATQKLEASANLANDPSGINAFNKRDVNRDGLVDLKDAFAVDKFTVGGQNAVDHLNRITSLTDQVNATINIDGGIDTTLANQRPVSLVDIEQTDDQVINNSDVAVINQGLSVSGHETWTGGITKNGVGDIVIARPISDAKGSTTITVGSGALLTINAGSFTAGGSVDIFTDTINGRHLAVVNNGVGSLNISAGTKNVAALTGVGGTNVSAGATLIADSIHQSSLTLSGIALIRAGGGSAGASTVNTLTITGSGKLDLNDNTLTVPYSGTSPVSSIRALLVSGFNSGNWDGGGIASLAAHTDPNFRTALGYIDTGFAINVKYTYYGDDNLDGRVNATDFQMFLDGLASNGSSWAQGDYTYDGRVDLGNDFNLFLVGYLTQGGALGDLRPAILSDNLLSSSQRAQLLSLVPEPTGAGLLATIGLGMAARRRRK